MPNHTNHSAPIRLLIATSNKGKLREFQVMLAGLPLEVCSLAEFPDVPEADEPHDTFKGNSRAKAEFYAARTGLPALADDSGLQVDALGGAPGVRSARYGGAESTNDERNNLLLRELSAVPDERRRARFVCHITVAQPHVGVVLEAVGVCEGRIARAPRGANGFGYDPIFIPEGHAETFAELDAEIKDRISHRARAMQSARRLLAARLTEAATP